MSQKNCSGRTNLTKSLIFLIILGLCNSLSLASVLKDLTELLSLRRHPLPPAFPPSFEVAYNFTLPYEREYLPDGLTFPVRVWRDEAQKKVRMDTYGGINSLIATKEVNLEISPRVDELHCAKFKVDPGELGLLAIPILPDVSGWHYLGEEKVNGQTSFAWEYAKRHGDKDTKYKFYAAEDGTPIRLHMHGNDAFSGAHFDVWVADYYDYQPGRQDGDVFTPPASCNRKEVETSQGLRSFSGQMMALVPAAHLKPEEGIPSKILSIGRQREKSFQSSERQQALQSNAEYVDSHNKNASKSYKLELNKFAAWTQEEFEVVMLPRHSQKRGLVVRHSDSKPHAALPYERLAPEGTLPGAVDWRGSLAESLVKDQAACGSCWSFAATGALEAAHLLATGEKALFSEQQLMDCSWGYGLNKACDGGDYDAAMDWLKLAGGPVQEKDYEYLGADAFCRDRNFSSGQRATFEGYSYIPPGDDEALMEAVYSRGPIAVSLDASQPGFRFYSGGVLDEPNCLWKSEDLDHAVLLVGYGTCPKTGKDYWLIKNSWSTYWGDNGYIKIARAHHGCGITTDPVYAVFKSARSTDA